MLSFIREIVTLLLEHGALLYATSIALRGNSTASKTARARMAAASEGPVELSLVSLKLWVMLMATAAFSIIGLDILPLFTEFRVIFMYLLVLAPSYTQQEVYNRAFRPLLESIVAFGVSLRSSTVVTRRLNLFVVRRCITIAIRLMNYIEEYGLIEEDAVRDIVSGLVFSRRALDDYDAMVAANASGGGGKTSAKEPVYILSDTSDATFYSFGVGEVQHRAA